MNKHRAYPAGFRPDIQALRALAVTLVVTYHLTAATLPGGFVGVDVFFVISGYLIVGHVVRSLDRGTFHVLDFWARRARRLLPAAFVVLLACFAFTLAVLPAVRWDQSFTQIGASALYVQNWALGAEAVDYMASQNDPSLVQHFWSLSVEEQFYIVLPIIAIILWTVRKSKRLLFITLAVLGAASLAYSIYATATTPSLAYFSTATRVWEFAAGALLSFAPALRGKARHVAAWAGTAAIIGSAALMSGSTPFPGAIALIPTAGAVALIAAAGAPSMPWASLRPVQYLGDISYSVYLWHWPLIVAYPYVLGHAPRPVDDVIIIAATLLLASASKYLVEDRFRRPRARRVWPTFAFTGATAIAIVAVAVAGLHFDADKATAAAVTVKKTVTGACWGASAMVENCKPRELATAPEFAKHDAHGIESNNCAGGSLIAPLGDNVECLYGDPNGTRTIVLTGDSHARQWMPALEAAALKSGWRIVSMVRSSCPLGDFPVIIGGAPDPACNTWRAATIDRIRTLHPDLVITSALTGFGYQAAGYSIGAAAVQKAGYRADLRAITSAGIPVVAIRDDPYISAPAPDCVAANPQCAFPRKDALTSHVDVLARTAKAAHLPVLDFSRYLCTRSTCSAVIGGIIVYQDQQHLTQTFARTLAPYLKSKLTHAFPSLAPGYQQGVGGS
jgi:peptidoglycan/LPS O-acetylase OafA/YrhL